MASNGTMLKRAVTMIAKDKLPGFTLVCPCCGATAVNITLDLSDLATCHCTECEDDFSVGTAVKMFTDRLAQWVKVQEWIDMAADVLADPSTESE